MHDKEVLERRSAEPPVGRHDRALDGWLDALRIRLMVAFLAGSMLSELVCLCMDFLIVNWLVRLLRW